MHEFADWNYTFVFVNNKMNIHFIAIGGSAMHNLAIALHKKGFVVSGSDDEILEPSKSRLDALNLLPEKTGWFPEKITHDLDAVILGMHARMDNPELIKSQQIGLKIYSYPEYIYEQTKEKTRVVIGGSHGKTTITSMILHVLKYHKIECDYLVGAMLEGFDTMVNLTHGSKIAILEGDEYLASPIDRRSKFHLYKADIGLISGIAWDHINVFPTFENYLEQFRIFAQQIPFGGSLIYCENDSNVKKIADTIQKKFIKIPYGVHEYIIHNGTTYLISGKEKIPLKIFGEHNLQNLNGAKFVCSQLGLGYEKFYEAIQFFKGAAKRLELVESNNSTSVFKDFAHSPSKLKATINAVKKQFPERKLIACMELHTFSSLSEKFLNEYSGAMNEADEAIVYFNPHTIEHKKLPQITDEQVKNAFSPSAFLLNRKEVKVFTNSQKMVDDLKKMNWENSNLLMMSSGNFDGVDFKILARDIL